jgi:hypothetical protein
VVGAQTDVGDVQTFDVRIAKPGRYLVGTGGNQDLVLELYHTASGRLVATDDNSGADANPRVIVQLAAADYTVLVRCLRKFGTGNYVVAVRTAGR